MNGMEKVRKENGMEKVRKEIDEAVKQFPIGESVYYQKGASEKLSNFFWWRIVFTDEVKNALRKEFQDYEGIHFMPYRVDNALFKKVKKEGHMNLKQELPNLDEGSGNLHPYWDEESVYNWSSREDASIKQVILVKKHGKGKWGPLKRTLKAKDLPKISDISDIASPQCYYPSPENKSTEVETLESLLKGLLLQVLDQEKMDQNSTLYQNLYGEKKPMRMYEGQLYSLRSAIEPQNRDYYCQFLNISSPRTAFIHYGYERFLEVGVNSKMILHRKNEQGKWSERLVKIPFVKIGGRLEFDYPAYLKESGIAFDLYEEADIYHSDDSNYHMVYCKNADITSGSFWQIDYNVYWLGIDYKKPLLYLNGKRVSYLGIQTSNPCTDRITEFVKAHLEQKHELSYAELAAIAANFKVRMDSCDIQVRFSDGTISKGTEIDWNATE